MKIGVQLHKTRGFTAVHVGARRSPLGMGWSLCVHHSTDIAVQHPGGLPHVIDVRVQVLTQWYLDLLVVPSASTSRGDVECPG